MTILIIINDAPYGSEKVYNALRLAMTLQKEHPDSEVRIFLMADGVGCALPSQITAQGYYNIERMLKSVLGKSGHVKACGSCVQARGLQKRPLIEGVEVSNMSELTQWALTSDKVVNF